MSRFKKFVRANSWVYVVVVIILLWLLSGLQTGVLSLHGLIDNAYTASFLAMISLGQMLVVTTGRGAIDLSLPGMVTLGAYVSMGICNGENRMILPALAVVIACGVVVGLCNSLMVIYLRLPAIIATMAMNYMIVTVTMLINNSFNVFTIPPILSRIATMRIADIPLMIFLVLALALLIHYLLRSTAYGKSLLAMGQNKTAARLAGVPVVRVEMLTYIFAAVLAGLGGALISARVTGAYLGMGNNYQLESIACCVVGGTLMSGGRANVFGTLVGSMFLYMIVSAMQLLGADAGTQSYVKGALIVVVLLIGASGAIKTHRRKALLPAGEPEQKGAQP